MKAIQLLPLAFFADVYGFIYFVPYMLLVLLVAGALSMSRRRARRSTAQLTDAVISLEAMEEPALAVVRV